MNVVITSREQILKTAKEIAVEKGVANISMRAVAAKSGISVGSIYNYFPSKSTLIIAIIEDFWLSAIRGFDNIEFKSKDFIQSFKLIYHRLATNLAIYQDVWIEQLAILKANEKDLGRRKEADYFATIKSLLTICLTNDQYISSKLWSDNFTKVEFADFVFENMLAILKNNNKNYSHFILILKKILY